MSVRSRIGIVGWAGLGMAEISLGMGMDWVWGVQAWARLKHLLELMRARLGIEWAGLGLISH